MAALRDRRGDERTWRRSPQQAGQSVIGPI
jgi:hypothetical protein